MNTNKPTWHAAFLQLYQRLISHYGSTVNRGNSEDLHILHAKNWQLALNTERIKSDEMMPALERVIRSQRFRTFAPNPLEFVGFVYKERARIAHGIPEMEEAFRQACGTSSPIHPLVSYVRNGIGGWYLRTNSGTKLRSLFVEKYDEAAEALGKGELDIAKISTGNDEPSSERKLLSSDEVSERISRLMGGNGQGC